MGDTYAVFPERPPRRTALDSEIQRHHRAVLLGQSWLANVTALDSEIQR